jgi:cardiolipin synthase A/B
MATIDPGQVGQVESAPARRAPRARRWVRRAVSVGARILLVVLFLVWWFVLRIKEDDSWPPPPDAVTSAQAQAATEEFLARDDVSIPDIGIPLAPSTLDTVQLFSDGTQFFPPMGRDMEAAESSIHIIMFTMTPGQVSDRVVEILKDRIAAGVEVRMVVDRYGSKVNEKSEPIFKELTEAGVEVVVNDIFPIDRDGPIDGGTIDPWQDEVGNADHRKMIVIDGKIGWIGGAGFEDHFYDGRYHDAYARVTGDIVRQMQLVFLTSFHVLGGPSPGADLSRYFPTPADPGSIPVTFLHNVPGGHLPGTQAMREVLEQAEGQLDILNPYMTDPGMIDRVVDAGDRGVDVTVVLPGASNVTQARDAAEHNYGRLFDAGVRIYEHETIIHSKVIVTNDKVVIGTINFDSWALYRNHEIALLIEDPAVADDARAVLIDDAISRAEPATLPEGRWNRLQNWFWDKLVYFI